MKWPFTVVEKDNKIAVQVFTGGKLAVFSAEEIAGMILHELKTLVESYFGQTVGFAVVTVPTSFNDVQRQAMKDAGGHAGLEHGAHGNPGGPPWAGSQCGAHSDNLELLNENLFQATVPHITKTLIDAGIDRWDVDYAILSGGSTHIPRVVTLVNEFFNNKTKVLHGINPKEVVAYGAAVQVMFFTPYPPSTCNCDDMRFSRMGHYGVEDVDGAVVIPIIPEQDWEHDYKWEGTAKSHVFTTASNGQSTFQVRLFRSRDQDMTTDKTLIAQLNLTGITQAPRGVAKIKVTVTLDERLRISLEVADVTPHWTDKFMIPFRTAPPPKASAHLDVGNYWDFPTKEETRKSEEEARIEKEKSERENALARKKEARFEFVSYTTALIERMRKGGRDLVRGRDKQLTVSDEKEIFQALAAARAWIENRDEFASSIDVVHEQRRRLESDVEPILARLSGKNVLVHDEL
ncbi:Endoplasmic reticulum chaperone BiP [Geranomyces variabilis]|uniref:Endoplasmic reticulum chaperone BiP n=1 Tax=Geranomyces variabilis TaxID=109894 RepID=A0AAD5TD44_9FUNG|nr:Endoplasmic reticulum chaperone BiP [Geranomyces variabilis]